MAVTLFAKNAQRLATQAAAARARAEANPTAANLTAATRLEAMAAGKTTKEVAKDVVALQKTIAEQNKAAKAEEKAQLDHLYTVQLGELDALRAAAKDQGLSAAEINKLVAAERAANTKELTDLRTKLNSQVGLQTIYGQGQGLLDIRSANAAYTGPIADNVSTLMNKVADNFKTYNLATYRDMDKDAFSGVTFNGIMRAELSRDENGQIKDNQWYSNFLKRAESEYGQSLTPDQIKGKLTAVEGSDNLFKASTGGNYNISGYYKQNADGTYTPVGYDQFRADRGVGIGAIAREAAPAIIASYFLTPMIAGSLAIPTYAAAAAVAAGKTALQGGSFEDILTSAASSAIGAQVGGLLDSGTADAAFAAADAAQLAGQGLSNAAIAQTLSASGVDPVLAASAADMAASGASASSIASSLSGFGDVYGNVVTGDLTGLYTTSPDAVPTGAVNVAPVDYSLVAESKFPGQGISANLPELPTEGAIGLAPIDYTLTPETITGVVGGQGLQIPTLPNLTSMGGGQGLSVEVPGGTVTQQGFIPTGSTPVLGDKDSFINNPEVLGQPVLPIGTTSTLGLKDILNVIRTGNTLTNLFGQKTAQPQLQPQPVPQPYAMDYTGVDYSGLLNLLSQRAKRADVASLLG